MTTWWCWLWMESCTPQDVENKDSWVVWLSTLLTAEAGRDWVCISILIKLSLQEFEWPLTVIKYTVKIYFIFNLLLYLFDNLSKTGILWNCNNLTSLYLWLQSWIFSCHYYSVQCHMIFQKSFYCDLLISFLSWKSLCCLIFLGKL